MTSSLPPGLKGNLVEYVRGGEGDWLPFDEKRFYTNAFVIQDDQVRTNITTYILAIRSCSLRYFLVGRNVDLASISK